MPALSIATLFAAFVQWNGVRKDLVGVQKRFFHRWLAVEYPDLWEPYRTQPALFRAQCEEVRKGLSVPTAARRLGVRTITKYSSQLVQKYLELSEQGRGTFQKFLGKIIADHANERSLKRYLGL